MPENCFRLDAPQKVYNEPANQFVAGFIGIPPMNFLQFEIVREKSMFLKLVTGSAHEHDNKFMIKVPDELSATISNTRDETIILGIRPKDITVLRKDEEFDGFKLKGEVTFIELLGDDSIAEVKLGQNSLKISNVASRIDNLIIGKEAIIGIKYSKLYLFRNSGERMNSSITPSSA